MRHSHMILLLLFLCSPLLFSQAILEHAAAAAVGSTAGVAGKPVSDGMSSILGKVGGTLQRAAETGKPAAAAPLRQPVEIRPAAWPVDSRPLAAVDFQKVGKGATRDSVLQHLGNPSSKVLIPEEGRTVELYRYARGGAVLGTVRIVDGSVETVDSIN